MKKLFLSGLLLCVWTLMAVAQNPTTTEGWAQRLQLFGEKLQQEEVFVHMDNSCYYLGDTIYYKVYMRRSDGQPSALSRMLYTELYNQDGYLVERQKVEMKNGQGWGSFCLGDTLYGGYYELRAYTRWQLNWGRAEHPHSKSAEAWFFSKEAAQDFYRDYEKLYSRVFPVYDKPKEAGDYAQEMTLRPMQRVEKRKEEKPQAQLRFYPEGGNLLQGVPSRVAFEANDQYGRHLQGKLYLGDEAAGTEAETVSRGRGSFLWDGQCTKGTFTWEGGTAVFSLPRPVENGVALQADVEADGIHVSLAARGAASGEALGLTASCHGLVKDFQNIDTSSGETWTAVIPLTKLPTGVIQLTVFNAEGRVYADRLVFVRHPDFQAQNISFSGVKSVYAPYELVKMQVNCPASAQTSSSISVAVRDASHSDYTFDTSNILTEMLLCSQIRGFVERPDYYFESDDSEHRQALDLLLMVQGWRRYDWHEMATPGAFVLNEPYERTEVLNGEVMPYMAEPQMDLLSRSDYLSSFIESENQMDSSNLRDRVNSSDLQTLEEKHIVRLISDPLKVIRVNSALWGNQRPSTIAQAGYRTTLADAKKLSNEVLLHAEFVQPGVANGLVDGEMETFQNGRFKIEAPRFYQACHFSLAASDTTKWKSGKQKIWVETNEDSRGKLNYPEFYVRLRLPYPRFVQPYTFYQTAMLPQLPGMGKRRWDDAILMKEIIVGANRSGLRRFDKAHPAFVVDALEAYNQTIDAGLCPGYYTGARRFIDDVARTYVGDMGMELPYTIQTRIEGKLMGINTRLLSEGELMLSNLDDNVVTHLQMAASQTAIVSASEKDYYDHLPRLDQVYVYTDYAPREAASGRYSYGDNPSIIIDLHRMPDNGQRMTWRDRRMVLTGFSVCEDFYQPDYSQQRPSTPTDYRRTLYWNPSLQLDVQGQAQVSFYNNCRTTQLLLSAEGMTTTGQPLTGISYPEDR